MHDDGPVPGRGSAEDNPFSEIKEGSEEVNRATMLDPLESFSEGPLMCRVKEIPDLGPRNWVEWDPQRLHYLDQGTLALDSPRSSAYALTALY